MSASLETRVIQVVADVFGVPVEGVSMDTTKDDVDGWDSVNVIHLVMALESEFGVSVSVEETADLLSVALIHVLLKEKGL